MSKELIEQLAKEHGKPKKSIMRPNPMGQQMLLDGYDFTPSELEAFAKAYQAALSDRVKELTTLCDVGINLIKEREAEIERLNAKLATYQAAAPIDNVTEALETAVRAFIAYDDADEEKLDEMMFLYNEALIKSKAALALIPDTQADHD
jgi:hypothetical protein